MKLGAPQMVKNQVVEIIFWNLAEMEVVKDTIQWREAIYALHDRIKANKKQDNELFKKPSMLEVSIIKSELEKCEEQLKKIMPKDMAFPSKEDMWKELSLNLTTYYPEIISK